MVETGAVRFKPFFLTAAAPMIGLGRQRSTPRKQRRGHAIEGKNALPSTLPRNGHHTYIRYILISKYEFMAAGSQGRAEGALSQILGQSPSRRAGRKIILVGSFRARDDFGAADDFELD